MIKARADRQTVIWAAAMLLVAAGFVFALTRPQHRRLGELQRNICGINHELTTDSGRGETIARLKSEVEKLATQSELFDRQVPESEQLGAFLQDLARFAERHKLRAHQVEPGKPAPYEDVVALPVSFAVQGSFPAIHALLRDIERMHRVTRIESVEAEAEEGDAGRVSARIGLKIFYRAS